MAKGEIGEGKYHSKLVYDYPRLILKIFLMTLTSFIWLSGMILLTIGWCLYGSCFKIVDMNVKKWYWY